MFAKGLKVSAAGLAISSLLFFSGCSRDPVVAKVDGKPIYNKDVSALLEHGGMGKGKNSQQDSQHTKALRLELINQLINEKLVFNAIAKENIKLDKQEVMNAYKEIIKAFPNEDEYLKKLKEKGMSKDFVLKSLEKDLKIKKLRDKFATDITISDIEAREFYDNNISAFEQREQFKLSLIRIDNQQEALKIKDEIQKGVSFEDMAVKYPAGHTEAGSHTDWITVDTFPAGMASEIRKISKGAFGGPIKGREGYYLIKVQDRKDKGLVAFDEVKEDIRQMLLEQLKAEKFQTWLHDERSKAKIEIIEKS